LFNTFKFLSISSSLSSFCSIFFSSHLFNFANCNLISHSAGLIIFLWKVLGVQITYVLISFTINGIIYSSDFLKNAINAAIINTGLAIKIAAIVGSQLFFNQFTIENIIPTPTAIIKSCHILSLNGQRSTHISNNPASTCFGTKIFIILFLFSKY
jgi:hypothetical protein